MNQSNVTQLTWLVEKQHNQLIKRSLRMKFRKKKDKIERKKPLDLTIYLTRV